MLLKYLIDDCPLEYGQTEITSLELKASDVKKGSAFFALKGKENDGNDYVSEAISRGAACIISERPISACGVACIRVEDERHALADISARFYGNPQKNMLFVGITGTNGKTTTSYMIKSILETAGFKTGIIGTLGAFVGDERVIETDMTTPDPPVLFYILSEMEKQGVTHVVMEVSAHALALKKTDGIVFD
ncbi:MAG: Mur ligase family protein, partial [Candidatus Neoclostridium sp.]